jgi:hypothetical protein
MTSNGLRRWLALLLALVFAPLAIAPAFAQINSRPTLRSGIFETLTIAVSAKGEMAGYYREDQGEGVVKRCSFFLASFSGGAEGQILTWNTDSFPGRLTARERGVTLRVDKGREHPGCGLVLLPEISSGLQLDLVRETEWQELRQVIARRAYLYSTPSEAKRLGAFVIQGDVVGVLGESGKWLRVEYFARGKPISGWMRAASLMKPLPPLAAPSK